MQDSKDNQIRRVIGGEGVEFFATHIEEGYLEREHRENLAEGGYCVDMPENAYSDTERVIRKSQRDFEAVEKKRAGGSLMKDRIERSWPEPEFPRNQLDREDRERVRFIPSVRVIEL